MMRLLSSIIVFLSFLLATNLSAEIIDCESVKENYQNLKNQTERTCSQASECMITNLDWNDCAVALAYLNQDLISQLLENRKELHRLCNYQQTTCKETQPSKSLCFNQTCRTNLELASLKDQKAFLTIKGAGKLIKGQDVQLVADTGIRCIEAPCPSSKLLKTFTTNQSGQIELLLTEILALLDSPSIGPDGLRLIIPDLGYHHLNLQKILVNFNETQLIHLSN